RQRRAEALLFLGKRCCESGLPFPFKCQPNIATQKSTRYPADGVSSTSLLHPPLPALQPPNCAADVDSRFRARPTQQAIAALRQAAPSRDSHALCLCPAMLLILIGLIQPGA